MNSISPGGDEKGLSTKQMFSSSSWYIYKLNRQGSWFSHIDSGTQAEGLLSYSCTLWDISRRENDV